MNTKPLQPLATVILQLIAERQRITFADVMTLGDVRGSVAILLAGNANAVAWAGLSDEAAEAVVALLDAGIVQFVPAEPLEYVSAGETLRLPVVKSAPALFRADARPHWCPVSIEPGPAWGTPDHAAVNPTV